MRSLKKALAFLAWSAAFVGGSTIFSTSCEITDDTIFIDIPGLYVEYYGDEDYDDD